MTTVLQINVEIDQDIFDKFLLYYPDKDAIADEIMRQVEESGAIRTGKPVKLKFRPYKEG